MPLNSESGRILFSIVKRIVSIAFILILLWFIIQAFIRILFSDSATEETIKELSNRALSASASLISGQNSLSNGELGDRTSRGYTVSTYTIDGPFFEITLYGVPKSVCTGIVERNWSVPTSLYINGQLSHQNPKICDTYNQLSFEFSRDLNENVSNADKPLKKHCQNNSDCSGCESCQNGRCQTACQNGETCAQTLKGKSVCCTQSNVVDSLCCSFTEGDSCCWGRNKCCPKDQPIYLPDGTCTDCYDTRLFTIGEPPSVQTCQKICPNRKAFGFDELCMLPICKDDQFMDQTGTCIDCNQPGGYATSATECTKCQNRSFSGGYCSFPCEPGSILNVQHQCVSCNDPNPILPHPSQSCDMVCPNRKTETAGCVLSTCPDGFITDKNGYCLSCSESNALKNISEKDCAQCPGREFVNGQCLNICPTYSFRDENGHCTSCQTPLAIPVDPSLLECQKCPERLALNGYCFAACGRGQFRDAFGTCRTCSDLGSYPVLQSAICSTCPDRSIYLHQINNQIIPYCTPQYCPIDYFADQMGSCHDCFSSESVSGVAQKECDKCPNRRWTSIGQTCQIKPECRSDEFADSDGNCHPCVSDQEAISVRGYPSECATCSNRYLFGSWCRQCPSDIRQLKDRAACQKCGGSWDNRISQCF